MDIRREGQKSAPPGSHGKSEHLAYGSSALEELEIDLVAYAEDVSMVIAGRKGFTMEKRTTTNLSTRCFIDENISASYLNTSPKRVTIGLQFAF